MTIIEDDDGNPESVAHALSIAAMATPCRDYQGAIYFAHNDQYPDAEFRDFGLARAFRVICNNAEAIRSALAAKPGMVSELPDALRVPLHELQADAAYLCGRVAADGSTAGMVTESILNRLSQIETACYELFLTPTKSEKEEGV